MLVPHLSTGGLPAFALKKIEILKDSLEIWLIEHEDITGGVLVAHRDKIQAELAPDHFISLNEPNELIGWINRIDPDFLHIEEIPEYFLPQLLADQIYANTRRWKIFETSHDSSFDPDLKKIYLPDAFFFVSQWQIDQYANIEVPKFLAEFPIETKERPDRDQSLIALGLDPSKRHVLNVGLFTQRKNQGEILEIARHFNDDVQFHFIGNQASNFEEYWKPLMENFPSNCRYWGERNDPDRFYECMDLFLFTSRGYPGNKETMPLVLREALGWQMPIMMYNLDVYLGYFNKFPSVSYLIGDRKRDSLEIKKLLDPSYIPFEEMELEKEKWVSMDYDRERNRATFRIIKTHPQLSKFNWRLRDACNGLTFNPIGWDVDFSEGVCWWAEPNAKPPYHNGILLEIFDNAGNIIDSVRLESHGDIKGHYSPMVYPKTEIWIGNKNVQLEHHPNDTSSFWSFYECWIRREYKNIEPGDCCVDVGANLGFFTLYALRQGAAKCYSLEPIPSTYEYLVQNTKGLQVVTINEGVGLSDEHKEFVCGDVTSMSRSSEHNSKGADASWGRESRKEKVRVKPFQQILNENGIGFIDYLKIDCEGGEVELFATIDPEFLRTRIRKISGEIHLQITGIEGYEKIKNQIGAVGFNYEDNYKPGDNLAIFYAEKSPKIRLVHILNHPEGEREIQSIKSLSELENFGIDYVQSISPLWKQLPPAGNCNRPNAISATPGDYLLSPGHYGCYLGHKNAVELPNNYDYDAIVIAECDAILQIPAKEMAEKMKMTYFSSIRNDLALVSFGKTLPGYPHQKLEDDLLCSDRIVEAHLYQIDSLYLPLIHSKFSNMPWDVTDLWYDTFFKDCKRGIYKKPYALQARGVSYLDNFYKDGHIIHDEDVIFNPSNENLDCTIVIQTCDKYKDLWEGWYLSWKRWWNPSIKCQVYFCNEELDLPFNDPIILQIKSGLSHDARGFSTRLNSILSQIKTRYVLYMQDDMWLTNELPPLVLKEALYKIRYNNWNCLRLHEKIWINYDLEKTSHFIGEKRVLRVSGSSEWLLTHNASIWNREFLLSVMGTNESPWKNEINGTVRIYKKETAPRIYHLDYKWYYQPGASQNGIINPFMQEYLRNLKLSEELKTKFDC